MQAVSVMAAESVMLRVYMLLSALFLSGDLATCPQESAVILTSPKTLEALSGSCLQIPCSFSVKGHLNSSRETFGIWIKNDFYTHRYPENVVFNSSGAVAKYPMKITGNLRQKSCTTLFSDLNRNYTDKYYFRVMNWPFRATAICDPIQITVKDSPWRPRVNISGDLKENKSVTITCSAVTSCPHLPPELTWNLQQDSHTQIKKNKDGTFTAEIQKSITLSDSHDGYKIICSVRYPVNEGKDFKTAETEETLRVSYAPKNTSASISPAGLVSAGTRVNLTCSSRASPPISSFSWFKKSLHGDVKVAEGDFYSLNETDGGVYYCVATNDLGLQMSPYISPNRTDSPRDTSLLISPTDAMSVGRVVNLTCLCGANPRAVTVTWFMTSDGRLEMIKANSQVYSFTVTSRDRDRLFYCGCRDHEDIIRFSKAHQLIFEGVSWNLASVYAILKCLGIVMLVSTLVIFECWFRSRATSSRTSSVQPANQSQNS